MIAKQHIDELATREFLGGNKPISRATLYRGIAEGRFPQPFKVGRASNRWWMHELVDALERASSERSAA